MKKLLITSMAAVAIGLYAKADDTGFTETSENFESKDIGPLFEQGEVGTDDEGKYIVGSEWSTAATPDDGIFTVTNIADIGYTLADGNTKALAIDTSTPLMRNAVTSGDASQTGYVMSNDESIFFDSLVQFTATESIPEPSSEDKLVIGLFADEDPEINTDLGALDNATNLVVISAILNNGAKVGIATNVIDNINTKLLVAPEEWHRLTIQVMNDSGYSSEIESPGFRVFVDGNEVKVGGVNKVFYSLVGVVNNEGEGENVIKGVAFDGKGAVDDIVFTTENPFVEPTYAIIATGNNASFEFFDSEEGEIVANAIPVGLTTVGISVNPDDNYALSSATFNGTVISALPEYNPATQDYYFEIEVPNTDGVVVAGSEFAFSVVMTSVAGSTTPTVGGSPCADETALKAVVKSGTEITVPSGWTVDGKELKDAKGDTFATFEYYNLALADGVVTATLDQKAAAPFAEELAEGEEVLELDETIGEEGSQVPAVGVRIKTYSGLWYGLGTAAELGSSWNGPTDWEDGTGGVIQLKAAKQGDTRFYKIVVTDIEPAQ